MSSQCILHFVQLGFSELTALASSTYRRCFIIGLLYINVKNAFADHLPSSKAIAKESNVGFRFMRLKSDFDNLAQPHLPISFNIRCFYEIPDVIELAFFHVFFYHRQDVIR